MGGGNPSQGRWAGGRLGVVNPAEVAAAVIVDELLRGGVRDVVLSPGQRSAPLAVALAAAESEGACFLHVRTDERVAGFLALGLARGSGAPVAVVCTSGSAVANLLPAVVEADASDLPLVLVTADRPAELLGVGANQTIDQVGIFGSRVRRVGNIEAPAWRDGAVPYWRSTVSQAINAATDVVAPGPVHINVALREPLLAGEGAAAGTQALPETAGRPAGLPWTLDARLTSVAALALDSLLEQLDVRPGPARGVVVVGDLPVGEPYPSEATVLAEAMGWPLLSEPSGNARDGGTAMVHGSLLAAVPGFIESLRPDLVVTVGRVGLTRSVNRLIQAAGLHIAVDPRPASTPVDPLRTAAAVVSAVPAPAESCRPGDDWMTAWLRADDAAEAAIATALSDAAFSGVAVARTVWEVLPDDALLLLGASWPVRFVDAYAPVREIVPWVIGNRGASGIDGLVATAWGATLAHQRGPDSWNAALEALSDEDSPPAPGGPGVALIGDLAFLYDGSALVAPAGEPRPDLTVVVIDNDGGGIFSGLEPADPAYAGEFERVFGTPMGKDLVAVAQSYGVPAVRVGDATALAEALAQAPGAGVRVVVCDVGDRAAEERLLRDIAEQVAAAVVGGLGA